jgi:hypothetical protein
VNHRHLLDSEIDLLLDGEVGFGVAPLRTHLAECAACRSAFDRERVVLDDLDRIPHLIPTFGFAGRVLAQTRVFVPWHVSALDAVRGWVPTSRPGRVAAAAGASVVGVVLTALVAWTVVRSDALVFFGEAGLERLRTTVGGAIRDGLAGLIGADAVASLGTGGVVAVSLAIAATVLTGAAAVWGFRSLATASRRAED